MSTWVAAGLGIALLTLAALLWVHLSGYRSSPARGAVVGSEVTLTQLQPMTRLVADEDLEFLKQFENCRPRIVERWEQDRRRIFRLYLREASVDFYLMHAKARQMIANAPEQEAAMVGLLMRQQLTFWRTLTFIELRLVLSGLGFGKLDGARIAALIEGMQAEINRAIVAPTPA
jgi:hypothetical protein